MDNGLLDTFKRYLLESQIRKQQGIAPSISLEDASKQAQYDYGGYINAALAGDPRASQSLNLGDNRMHFPDPWKMENHPTHLWKTMEDYATQARYAPLTDQEYANSFNAMSEASPVYQRMIKMEGQYPDYGIGGYNSQQMITNFLYQKAKGGDGNNG